MDDKRKQLFAGHKYYLFFVQDFPLVSGASIEFCIKPLFPPYNCVQNGVAERMNLILMETAHLIMLHSKMPNEFGPTQKIQLCMSEIATILVFLEKHKTPLECFYNRKPEVSNLRVFG